MTHQNRQSLALSVVSMVCFACVFSQPAFGQQPNVTLQNVRFTNVQTSPVTAGPGTEMTKIINNLGLGSNCSRCKTLAQKWTGTVPTGWFRTRTMLCKEPFPMRKNLDIEWVPARKMGVRMIVNRSVRRSR